MGQNMLYPGYVNWAKKFNIKQMAQTVKSLQAEYADLLAKKKAAYTEYRTAREEMKELLLHKSNIDRMLEKEEVKHDKKKKKHERW